MTMGKEKRSRKQQPGTNVPSVTSEPQEQEMGNRADEESLAATDEFFIEQAALPEPFTEQAAVPEPKLAEDSQLSLSLPADDRAEPPLEPSDHASPLQDYVREIQEEFEEQEEEGKL
jgi:hypothetical protein